MVNINERPYTDSYVTSNTKIRIFEPETKESELIWHRDLEDRAVDVLDGYGWQFQFDNELPFLLNKGDTLFIPNLVYHRLILGETRLIIRIEENNHER